MSKVTHDISDELVDWLFDLRSGDLTIDIQDDMPLVTVYQRNVMIGIGSTITEALGDAINVLENGENPHDPLGRMEVEPEWMKETEDD